MERITDEQLELFRNAFKGAYLPLWELDTMVSQIKSLQQQVEQMRKALEWYACKENYTVQPVSYGHHSSPVMRDKGNKAAESLQSISKEEESNL